MATPLISIIIPTRNYAPYIAECIMSVLNQSYKNLEIIVVDDGSTDDTIEIIKKFSQIKYFYQQHKGHETPARAMNKGITNSNGDFIVCLGADDKLDPRYVESCLKEILKDDKIGFVWTGTQEFGESDEVRLPRKFSHNFRFYRNPGGQLGAMMVRKRVYSEVGLYDESLRGLEDWDFVIRAATRGWKGRAIPEVLHYTRVHKKRVTSRIKQYNVVRELEAKHPLMKPYAVLCRIFNIILLFFKKPKVFCVRLWNKTISGFLSYNKILEFPDNSQHPWVSEKNVLRKIVGQNVLDCGCRVGRWGYLLKKKVKKCYIVGIDVYKPYLRKAKFHRSYDDLILGDVSRLPLKRKSFDTALAIEVIERLPKDFGKLFLKQLREVTRKRIILTTPKNEEAIYFGENHPETHKSYWTKEEIMTCLQLSSN